MSQYRYRAARSDGAIVTGVLEASQAAEASGTLVERGLFPIALESAAAGTRRVRPASRRDLAIVFRSLASLASAGVPVAKALAASEAVARGRLRQTLAEARVALQQGKSLGQVLEESEGLVPGVAVGMVRAGERGSRLGPALEEVASHLEHEAELAGRVRQALAYPMVLLVAGTVAVIVIGTVVVPRFAELLGDVGQRLPTSTRLLLAGSGLLRDHGLMVLAGAAVTLAGLGSWLQRPAGALWWDRMLLALPAAGTVHRGLGSARLCRALGGMLKSGLPLLPALDAVGEAVGSPATAERLARARERVAQGEPLAAALGAEEVVTESAVQLIAVGESSGQLAGMTARAGDLAAQEAERGLKTLVTLIEPALIVVFGGLVAFVAAALLQAVYGLRAV